VERYGALIDLDRRAQSDMSQTAGLKKYVMTILVRRCHLYYSIFRRFIVPLFAGGFAGLGLLEFFERRFLAHIKLLLARCRKLGQRITFSLNPGDGIGFAETVLASNLASV